MAASPSLKRSRPFSDAPQDDAGLLLPETEFASLVFEDGTRINGVSFGATRSVAGGA